MATTRRAQNEFARVSCDLPTRGNAQSCAVVALLHSITEQYVADAALELGAFRNMCVADLPEILRIEQQAYAFAWSEGVFRDCLQAGYYCQVLATPSTEMVQGYGVLSAAVGEAHILNVCVRRSYQGRGFAHHILGHLLEIARAQEVQSVFLEVRASNHAALRLYAAAGFGEIGRRAGYYPAPRGRREDALIMAKELSGRAV